MSATTSPDKLVHMANQIGTFFASQGEASAVDSTADHIRKFWDPRMRARILAHLDAGGDGLAPVVASAVAALREGAKPA
jgi:formate dehydrogenase subunit delta